MGGKLESPHSCLYLGEPGVEARSKANVAGHYLLSVATFDFGHAVPAFFGAALSAARFSSVGEVLCREICRGGICFAYLAGGA